MRLFLSLFASLALSVLSTFAQQEQFKEAQTAYDNGRFSEAALL